MVITPLKMSLFINFQSIAKKIKKIQGLNLYIYKYEDYIKKNVFKVTVKSRA